jgi:CMP-N,N'-diacetyllegionaminic acid synthase
MSPTLALIPAKQHSSGVPRKNWKPIHPDGRSCTDLAVHTAIECGCHRVVVSTDGHHEWSGYAGVSIISRPPNTPDEMLAVVGAALAQVPGPEDEIIVLLQPTSPLRTSTTVTQAIQAFATTKATSVVSVRPSYPLAWSMTTSGGYLSSPFLNRLGLLPPRRQECSVTYKRDGTVYAFRRKTFAEWGDIYGPYPLPLHTPPAESLSIDTPEDWDEAVRRLAAASR